jgi:hypothetical protein
LNKAKSLKTFNFLVIAVMNFSFFNRLLSTTTLATLAFSASATTTSLPCTTTIDTVSGTCFVNGTSTYTQNFADGVATFTSTPGRFEKKSQGGITGVGISGLTGGEIDIGEMLTGSFSHDVNVSSITLGLLFDGPEYGDVREVAKITAYFVDGGSASFTLTATGTHSAIWSLSGGNALSIGSGSVNGGTGAWTISNPFGNRAISSLTFTAIPGVAAPSCHNCTNQSDYTFVSMRAVITPVPEPETISLLLVGLGLMGAVLRHRTSKT